MDRVSFIVELKWRRCFLFSIGAVGFVRRKESSKDPSSFYLSFFQFCGGRFLVLWAK